MSESRLQISRRTLGRLGFGTLAAACLPSGASAQGAGGLSPAMQALYEAARKEGSTTLYTSFGAPETVDGLKKLFENRFPGVKLNIFLNSANRAYQRLRSEIAAGIKECDIVCVSGWNLTNDLKKDGLLLKYTPVGEENAVPSYRGIDPDGFYYTGIVGHNAIAYNTQLVSDAEAPKTWDDLLDPKWKGQIATGHPAASGTVATWAIHMYLAKGESYLTKLAAQQVLVGQSIIDAQARVVSGERKVGVVSDYSALLLVGRGDPIKVVYPSDGATLIRTPMAIMKDATRPNGAKLFMSWLYTREAADYYVANGLLPLIKGVRVSAHMTAPEAINAVTPTLDELTVNHRKVLDFWRRAFGA